MSNLAFKIEDNSQVVSTYVPNISGGFGEGKRSMLAKHIAEIHGKELKKVNEVINNNRKRFNNFVDVIDLKQVGYFCDELLTRKILSKAQIGNAKTIFLLSESGYRILCNIFEDSAISRKVLKEYFNTDEGVVVFAEKRKEILFRKEVNKLFDGLCTVIPQYYVDGYRIDLYIPELNIAIEYDEKAHKYRLVDDIEREQYISNKLGCKFIRVNEDEDYVTAVNKILKAVYGETGMTERDRMNLIFKSKTERSWELYEKVLDKILK